MFTHPSPTARTEDSIGFSVYAQVDPQTLRTLDRVADEQVLPRSWLIRHILEQWAVQHAPDMDTVDLPEGQSLAA